MIRPLARHVIGWGGGAIAVLDIANAMTFWAIYRGTSPTSILQSIAAGLLGREAFAGGAASAALGAALHLGICFAIAGVYYLGCVRWPGLLRKPALHGAIYGAGVYLVMNHVVVPLSRAIPVPFIPVWFLDNLLGHILLVGLPLAYLARGSAARRIRQSMKDQVARPKS